MFLSLTSDWLESHHISILKPVTGGGNDISIVGIYKPRFSPLGLGAGSALLNLSPKAGVMSGKSEAWSFLGESATIMHAKSMRTSFL